MSHNPPEDFHNYGCFGARSRRSPTVAGNNPNNPNNNTTRRGLFHIGHGGRTVLPPLHLPFRASRSPAPDPTVLANQYAQQDTGGRTDYNVAYGQAQWPVNPNTASAHPQSTPFPTDPRYPQQNPNYPSQYPGRTSSIPSNSNPSRTLPPPNPQGQYFQQAGIPAQTMSTYPHTRSPTTSFSSHHNPYDQNQQQLGYYSADPRVSMGVPQMGYPQQQGAPLPRRPSMSVDRTVPSRMSSHGHGAVPYARIPPAMASPYEPEPEVPVKKKRKRADAEQLKVLNETYNRTAFPSTEERIELAKKLGMSARSVQIWFQNKRQAMRQSNRQAANNIPPTTTEPFTATPAPSSLQISTPSPHSPPANYGAGAPSVSMAAQGYGQRLDQYGRPIPSPPPSSQYRGRSYDEHERRSSSRAR